MRPEANASLGQFAASDLLSRLKQELAKPKPFNVCTVLGLARQELRHSDLLAYLLNPQADHGLGDRFLRAIIKQAAPGDPVALEAGKLTLELLKVQREWEHIDIFVLSPADRLAIIIENKVDSDEHSNQLKRYYDVVQKRYPGWRILAIYLTLYGTPPEHAHDRERYVPLSYTSIADALSEAGDAPIEPDVRAFIRHYSQFIRSELVPDQNSDQARLARALYRDHEAAVQAMIAARTTRQNMIYYFFDKLLSQEAKGNHPRLAKDQLSTDAPTYTWYTRFAPPEWYHHEPLVSCEGWTRTKMLLLFQFIQSPKGIILDLTVGPAPQQDALRQRLYTVAEQFSPLAQVWQSPKNDKFSIYRRVILDDDTNFFVDYSDDAIRQAIASHWRDFLTLDLPVIRSVIGTEVLAHDWGSAQ